MKNGPYVVTGSVPLSEKVITPKGKVYVLTAGRELPQSDKYALCRCGKSRTKPFCDGTHETVNFPGTETASKAKYRDRADLLEGPGIDLLDDNRCAFSRFCHSEDGSTWQLVENSDQPGYAEEAIKTAGNCIAGRLVAVDKAGNVLEPEYEPSIEIIQDPQKTVSAGIFVKGNIPIESSDGQVYEIRNRVALCRCGKSRNKPFCDATHVAIEFSDKK
ncbi:MAG: CDGSH iron-sulfur domain-containing protein [Candidatus Cryosericum sp.]